MNYKKILNSKWTLVTPIRKEKHFVVIKVVKDLHDSQVIESLTLEAIMTKRLIELSPSELKDSKVWTQGWR